MVTHKMLEILALVARLPSGYRRVKRHELKADYEAHLRPSAQALDAFRLLIEEKQEDQVSEEGRACYKSVVGSARQAVRSLASR